MHNIICIKTEYLDIRIKYYAYIVNYFSDCKDTKKHLIRERKNNIFSEDRLVDAVLLFQCGYYHSEMCV